MFLGRCYTICNVLKWAKKFGPNLQLKTDFDVKVFVHSLWDEFWLNGINEIPFEYLGFNKNLKDSIKKFWIT